MESSNAQIYKSEQLLVSIKINDVKKLEALLGTSDVNVEVMDTHGNTPLLLAAYYGHYHCVEALLNSGTANYKHINYFGQNAVTLATYAGSKDCVRLLLNKWSYKDYTVNSRVPPICVAAIRGHLDLIKLYCNFYPPPDSICTAHSVDPLTLAIANSQYHIVEYLSRKCNSTSDASHKIVPQTSMGRRNSQG